MSIMLKVLTPLILVLAWGFLAQRFALWRSAQMLDAQSQPLNEPLLARVLAALAKAQGIAAIRVHVLASDAINGLAAADGRIFLTRGFHRRLHAGDVTPEELASVVAHEIGHVALGHSRRRMIDYTGHTATRFVLATLLSRFLPGIGPWIAGIATSALVARLSQRDEFEADAYAAALLTKAGIGTGPQKSLLAKLSALAGSPQGQSTGTGLAWLASHPETRDRVAAIEALERRWGAKPSTR